jgi:hypothetical protein
MEEEGFSDYGTHVRNTLQHGHDARRWLGNMVKNDKSQTLDETILWFNRN